jgi:hypothetical protein
MHRWCNDCRAYVEFGILFRSHPRLWWISFWSPLNWNYNELLRRGVHLSNTLFLHLPRLKRVWKDDVMIVVLMSSSVYCEFDLWLGSNPSLYYWYLCFSAKYATMRKINYMLARNQNNVSEWCNMSTYGYLRIIYFRVSLWQQFVADFS